MALTGEAKREYQREYMRQRRTADKAARWKNDKALAIAEWCKVSLVVPTGLRTGKRFVLADFQSDWLRGAMSPGIVEAFLSLPRKNGKSSLIAAVLLAYLVGPLNTPNFHAAVISLQGSLSKELRENVELLAESSGLIDQLDFRKTPEPGHVTGHNGAKVTFFPAGPATGNAIAADLVIVDEAGLMQEKLRDMWEATLQSISSRNGRLWAISIRADGPMFSELIQRQNESGVYGVEYAAAEDADIVDESVWRQANPGIDAGIKSLEYMRHMSNRAATNPAYEPQFLAKDLNLPLNPSRHMITTVAAYKACLVDTLPPTDGPVFVGIDLGSNTSMSGAAYYWPVTGRLEVFGAWPSDPDLIKRGKKDSKGMLYLQMHQRGELSLYPGPILPVNDFVRELKARLKDCRSLVKCAGADRHRWRELTIAFNLANIRWPIEWRYSTTASIDNSEDVRRFQAAILGQTLKTTRNLVLESAIKQSSVVFDTQGHPKLEKSNSLCRIDALSAAVIAVGLGDRWKQAHKTPRRVYGGCV